MKRSTLTIPETLLVVILSLATLGQFERWLTPLGQVSWHEIGMGIFIIYVANLTHHRFRLVFNQWLFFFTTTFLLWTLFTTILNAYWLGSPLLLKIGGAYLARLTLYLLFGASVWLATRIGLIRRRRLQLMVLMWFLVMVGLGIGQYLFFPDARLLVELGWDDHLNRAFGTLLDPGFFGLLMAMGSIWSLTTWSIENKQQAQTWWRPVVFGVLLLALTLSFSRASYLAFIVGILFLAWVRRSRRTLLFIPLLVMALVLVPKDGGGEGQKLTRTNSVAARVEVAEFHTKGLTLTEMLIGRGWYYESVRQLHVTGIKSATNDQIKASDLPQHAQAVDNSYLHIFLSTGIVGLILFGVAVITYLKGLSFRPVLAVIAVLLTHSVFSTGLFYPWALLILGLIESLSAPCWDKNNEN